MSEINDTIAAHDVLVERFLECTKQFPDLFKVRYSEITSNDLIRIGPCAGSVEEICVHYADEDYEGNQRCQEVILPAWYLTADDAQLQAATDVLKQEREEAAQVDAERRRHRAELDERREFERLAAKFGGKS